LVDLPVAALNASTVSVLVVATGRAQFHRRPSAANADQFAAASGPFGCQPLPEATVHVVTQQVPVSRVDNVDFRPTRAIELPRLPVILSFIWIIGVGWSLARLLVAWQGARKLRSKAA